MTENLWTPRQRVTRRGLLRRIAAEVGAVSLGPTFAACTGNTIRKSGAGSPTASPANSAAPAMQQPSPDASAQPQILTYRRVSGQDLKLYLYLPTTKAGSRPAVVFFHGGGWQGNSPLRLQPQAQGFAAKGYVAASAAYRFSNVAPFPAAVADAKASVRWLRRHATEYGIDPKRIGAGGDSAGGQLAAMIATTPGMWEDGEDLDQSSAVQVALLLNAHLDLRSLGDNLPYNNLVQRQLGGSREQVPQVYEAASPITHVGVATPPTLLLHGTDDHTVPYAQSVAFRDAVIAAGGVAELFTAQGADHAFFTNPPWSEPTLAAMLTFAGKNLGAPPSSST